MKPSQKTTTNKPAFLARKISPTISNNKQTLAPLILLWLQIHSLTSAKQHIKRSFNNCLEYQFDLQKTISFLFNLVQKHWMRSATFFKSAFWCRLITCVQPSYWATTNRRTKLPRLHASNQLLRLWESSFWSTASEKLLTYCKVSWWDLINRSSE